MNRDLPSYEAIIERLDRLACQNPNERLSGLFVDAASEFRNEGYRVTTDDLISIVARATINNSRREPK